jgi:O-antigen ligase
MSFARNETMHRLEIGLLVALCFFLPLIEAPKNLAWLLYGAVWAANRVRRGESGGRWDTWDTLIATWIASGFLVALFAGLDGNEWGGAMDLFRYASILWLVKRSRYSDRELGWVIGSLVASTVIGLVIGYVRLWTGIGKSGLLQLYSVGHVNHTAIYVAIVLGVCCTWLLAGWHRWKTGFRTLGLLVTGFVLVSLVVTASRGAIGVGLALLLVIAAAWWPRSRLPAAAMALTIVLVIAGAILGKADVVQKQLRNVENENVLAFRDGIWRAAITAWQRHPWFGVGMDNYEGITLERLTAWDAEAGKPVQPDNYFIASHAHNLYANTLAERGIFGFGAIAAVLLAWAFHLLRRRPGREDPDGDWLAWGCSLAAWTVTVGVGLVNTTLHHEHGILAALLLGLSLSRLEGLRSASRQRSQG